ncbi:EF-hand domain-containing protein [Novosphingobium resinovorum]|uniref:EF-hand domain-containing protein n=1 Tax=Novosphingobium resinovorum TaxID=158500 RepID=UPI002ED0246B|nr:EF-hand domain-containing protein [Novosphingobium resinovorum]
MTKTLIYAGLALALASPQAAFAQDAAGDHAGHTETERRVAPGHGKDAFVRENDTDHDGRVTAAEFAAARAAKYKTFDLDGDGKVSEAEYVGEFTARFGKDAAVPEGQLKQAHVRFGVLDTDKDGNLTLAEFNASGERMFEKLDTNGDGVVDAKDSSGSY